MPDTQIAQLNNQLASARSQAPTTLSALRGRIDAAKCDEHAASLLPQVCSEVLTQLSKNPAPFLNESDNNKNTFLGNIKSLVSNMHEYHSEELNGSILSAAEKIRATRDFATEFENEALFKGFESPGGDDAIFHGDLWGSRN